MAILRTTNDDHLYTFLNYLEQLCTSLALHFTNVLVHEKVQEVIQNHTALHIPHSGLQVRICTFQTKDQLSKRRHIVPFLSDHLARMQQMVIFGVSNSLRLH